MRDNFTLATKRSLAERAGYICSNPACRRSQLGPAPNDKSKSVNLGVAAHICAAAPGGPRYDKDQTKEERSSLENGIFLCGACAGFIDKNGGVGHSCALLSNWKREHEQWIQERLNRNDIDVSFFNRIVWQDVSSVGVVGHAKTVNFNQNGISYSEVREIVLDVLKANYSQLSEKAEEVARERAKQLTDEQLSQLKERNFEAVNSAKPVSTQGSIGSVQDGDADLSKLVVEITFEGIKLDDVCDATRKSMRISLAKYLGLTPEMVGITSIREGSVIVGIELPQEAAARLVVSSEDPELQLAVLPFVPKAIEFVHDAIIGTKWAEALQSATRSQSKPDNEPSTATSNCHAATAIVCLFFSSCQSCLQVFGCFAGLASVGRPV